MRRYTRNNGRYGPSSIHIIFSDSAGCIAGIAVRFLSKLTELMESGFSLEF